jgi:hypothetical protein
MRNNPITLDWFNKHCSTISVRVSMITCVITQVKLHGTLACKWIDCMQK